MPRPIRLRSLAAADIEAAADRYETEAGEQFALDFVDAADHALHEIAANPQLGSLRFSYDLSIRGLRSWRLPRFPCVVFYVVAPMELEVWRVLHVARDVPTTLDPAGHRAPTGDNAARLEQQLHTS